ncbi:MAG TPA: phosphomethylpyrimidine synthase ThiC [Candidatus Mcinerneyibacterium sp.]|nr:phosphomethylpyrimidine synthase ThiC [Candidatus Mcinerneyibacterium sp.]
MTQLEAARKDIFTEQMKIVAKEENVDRNYLIKAIAKGKIVIPSNKNHTNLHPYGIGGDLRIKVNANIGTSLRNIDLQKELDKVEMIENLNAESVMDLSTAGDLDNIRKEIIKNTSMMVGTVPIYQILTENSEKISNIDIEDILHTIDKHGKQGVDFITVHCGIKKEALSLIKDRTMGIVSRGGSFISRWMKEKEEENPLYEYYDEILKIAQQYDMTLSLGDGLRPGAIVDATDRAQLHELNVLGELTERARESGVQVMVEGPGHVPLNEIKRNMDLQKEICNNAPFYVLGPLTTDIAPGYDHIVGAIGGSLAAYFGASFLCYVTPAEHLRLPTIEDVKAGVVASKIAAHTADLAKGNQKAWDMDQKYAKMRHDFDWEGMFKNSIEMEKPYRYRKESTNFDTEECSMCGDFCALKMLEKELE